MQQKREGFIVEAKFKLLNSAAVVATNEIY
jgi:hypothetical protein